MKTMIKKICIVSLCVLSFMVYSCSTDDETMSKSERLQAFFNDLNAGKTSKLYEHCHPSADMYAASRAPTVWNTIFPSNQTPYSLDSYSGGSTVLHSSSTLDGLSISFTMKEDGSDNWKISEIFLASAKVFW